MINLGMRRLRAEPVGPAVLAALTLAIFLAVLEIFLAAAVLATFLAAAAAGGVMDHSPATMFRRELKYPLKRRHLGVRKMLIFGCTIRVRSAVAAALKNVRARKLVLPVTEADSSGYSSRPCLEPWLVFAPVLLAAAPVRLFGRNANSAAVLAALK